jgi:hypothetical protein
MFRKLSAFALAMVVATPAIACDRPGMNELYRDIIAGGERSWHEPVPLDLPNFSYKDADGNTVSLKDHRGKAMIVTFWHPACAGCKIDLPRLDAFLDGTPGIDPDQLVQISVERLEEGLNGPVVGTEEVKDFLQRRSYDRIGANLDPDNTVFNAMCMVATPSHLMIDSEGRLTDVLFGPLRWSEAPFVDIARNYLANY